MSKESDKKKSDPETEYQMAGAIKSGDVPVSRAYVDKIEDWLSKTNTAILMELKAFRGEVESRFEQVNARFDRIESQLNRMESKIDQILALMQAQEDRNRYVLDGYASGRQRRSSWAKRRT